MNLHVSQLKKNKLGCATQEADLAQIVRRERSGHWDGVQCKMSAAEALRYSAITYNGCACDD
jgi:hypothetical protein